MKLFIAAALLLIARQQGVNATPEGLEAIPTNPDDFDEPAWEAILELAFPTWAAPEGGCPRLDSVGGTLLEGYTFPTPEAGKFNPCYYTKAFAGLDPILGGYPTPIDTHYPYEFAAPFLKQPGDGSTHHCTSSDPLVDVGSCPKQNAAPDGACDGIKDCAGITDEYGIGHIPPFVALASVKNGYNDGKDVCKDWFHFPTSGCNIKKSALDELVYEYFGVGTTIQFQPPILIDGAPSSTYYKLEYVGESPACDDGNCRGPHYCSKEVSDAGGIWGDFCPYVLTGENSGLYRHPHLALAALELWIANQCMPDNCPSTWLDSPNGQGYGTDSKTATSITWSEMADNSDAMSQPALPYAWPNKGDGIFPGYEMLYPEGSLTKPAPGMYVNQYVSVAEEEHHNDEAEHDGEHEDHDDHSHEDVTGDEAEPAPAPEEGGAGTSRSLMQGTNDRTYQATLYLGGFILAVGGFIIAN